MNYLKGLNLKLGTILVMFGILLSIASCTKNENGSEGPFLKVENQTNDSNSKSITSLELVGYEFSNLNIAEGNSQTFNLDSGMPGGYENININVRLSGPQIVLRNIEVDFNKGETTTITMKGCISQEGCDGFYLE